MFRVLGSLCQRLRADASRHGSPQCVASGIAIGFILGFIPWDNLISIGLIAVVLMAPVHQVSVLLSLLLTAGLHVALAPVPNAVGAWILSSSWTLECLYRISSIPLVPWLRLNNTLVLGSVCLGVLTAVPNWVFLKWCWPQSNTLSEKSASETEMEAIHMAAATYRKTNVELDSSSRPETELSSFDVPTPNGRVSDIGVVSAADFSVDITVDLGIATNAILFPPSPETNGHAKWESAQSSGSGQSASISVDPKVTETLVRDTWIEVVRFRSMDNRDLLRADAESFRPSVPRPQPISSNLTPSQPMLAEKSAASPEDSNVPAQIVSHETNRLGAEPLASSFPAGARGSNSCQHTLSGPGSPDALRYLLRHLAANRANRDGAATQ
jgi:uncharacterized protein (TIGR03546 family)